MYESVFSLFQWPSVLALLGVATSFFPYLYGNTGLRLGGGQVKLTFLCIKICQRINKKISKVVRKCRNKMFNNTSIGDETSLILRNFSSLTMTLTATRISLKRTKRAAQPPPIADENSLEHNWARGPNFSRRVSIFLTFGLVSSV